MFETFVTEDLLSERNARQKGTSIEKTFKNQILLQISYFQGLCQSRMFLLLLKSLAPQGLLSHKKSFSLTLSVFLFVKEPALR